MQPFNKNDFNCNEIPLDWLTYKNTFISLHENYVNCFNTWYSSIDLTNLDASCQANIASLYTYWLNECTIYLTKLDYLMDELIGTDPSYTCTFDRTKYYDYMESYNKMISKSDEIKLMVETSCNIIGLETSINVDLKTVYPTNGLSDITTTKCTGVYMKQMDFGSEFIGKVEIIGMPIPNSQTYIDPIGQTAISDGSIFIGNG